MNAPVLKQQFKMTCPNCGANDWHNVDEYRLKPAGMHICGGCQFVSYPEKWASYEDIKAHYRTNYRKAPTSSNFFTGHRKLFFHQYFLDELFREWQTTGLKPNVFEVGAAYGLVLSWMRERFPQGTFNGTEWALTYKRVAKHIQGIDLVDDFDDTKKYDLIMSYKVAEHQLDIDKELRRYALSLTENGRVYISVPTWFDSANNFGLSGFDLEYYYDPNHINLWTRPMFENMLSRAGLEIIKKDYMIYDSTYLCKRNDSLMTTPVFIEAGITERMAKIKDAYLAFNAQDYDKAISIYPDYPQAHVSRLEYLRAQLHKQGWAAAKKEIDLMLKSCPTSVEALVCATDFAMRFEQWEQSIKWAEMALAAKPENVMSLNQIAIIMSQIAIRSADSKGKEHHFKQALNVATHLREVSPQHLKEATDMIYNYASQIPIDSELKN